MVGSFEVVVIGICLSRLFKNLVGVEVNLLVSK